MSNIVEFVYKLKDNISPSLVKIASSAANTAVKLEQTRSKFDKLGSSINGVNTKINQLLEKRNASTSISEIRKLNGEIKKLERQAQKLENLPPQGFINRLRYSHDGLSGLAKTALKGYGIMQAWQGLKMFANLGMDMEQTRAKFSVLMGTVEKGNKMIADLNGMANKTPFQNADLIKNAETLLAFNMAGEKILPTMEMLGNVAMGDKTKLQGLTLAYAQMMSTGRLMGQDLLQMINQGFNPLVELEKMTGKPLSQLKKAMEEGKISSQMVEEAFKHATAEGGQFYQMMDKMSETGAGKFSTFLGKLQAKLTEYAERLNPYIVKLMNFGIAFVDNFEKIIQPFVFMFKVVTNGIITVSRWMNNNKGVVIALTAVIAVYKFQMWAAALATKGWTVASMLQYKWLLLVETAQKLLNATILKNPYMWAAAGIILLVGTLVTLRNRTREASNGLGEVNKKAAEYAADEKARLDLIFDKLRATNPKTAERNRLIKELKEMYPGLLDNMNLEKAGLDELGIAYQKIINVIDKKARARAHEDTMVDLYKERDKFINENEDLITERMLLAAKVSSSIKRDPSDEFRLKALNVALKPLEDIDEKLGNIRKASAKEVSSNIAENGNSTINNTPSSLTTISDLTSGGSKATNIHINFRNLIENLSMYPQTVKEGVNEVTDELIEGMLRVVNSTNRIAER